jgi:hypothetical protein
LPSKLCGLLRISPTEWKRTYIEQDPTNKMWLNFHKVFEELLIYLEECKLIFPKSENQITKILECWYPDVYSSLKVDLVQNRKQKEQVIKKMMVEEVKENTTGVKI